MRRTKKKLLLAAINSGAEAYGIDLISANGPGIAIQTNGLEITPLEGEELERELDDGKNGNKQMMMVGMHVKMTGNVELTGSGAATTPVPFAPIMQVAGFSATPDVAKVAYSRLTDNSEPDGTFYFHQDGAIHKLLGARGTIGTSLKVGEIPRMSFEITGLYGGVVAGGIPAADFSAWQTPEKVGHDKTTFKLDGVEYKMYEFEHNENNEVAYDENTVEERIYLTDWKPDGQFVIEAPDVSEFDPFPIARANTLMSMDVIHGTAAGKIFELSTAKIQLGKPTYTDREGKVCYTLPFRVIQDVAMVSK
ncbi:MULTISPECIES: hypothetical protein [Idiomarina]|uniref:hypothetical protein n=1 Tax=Idiomarina TaxID=135575 RepID=UPI00129B894C|nr:MULTISPECIES: hypothetical protein [Idiomarina]MRJ40827.1 hypothetical protein [Idiomarina sp. FeN1]NCU56631.1 hypothetical protein [Idiomarina sp. FenA--70]NCU59011.1 hypothetical protein [Idiomarina sp. FenBw--71]UUN14493.1 hypothetical protein KGF88_04575 [Idiomarina loihiensis]